MNTIKIRLILWLSLDQDQIQAIFQTLAIFSSLSYFAWCAAPHSYSLPILCFKLPLKLNPSPRCSIWGFKESWCLQLNPLQRSSSSSRILLALSMTTWRCLWRLASQLQHLLPSTWRRRPPQLERCKLSKCSWQGSILTWLICFFLLLASSSGWCLTFIRSKTCSHSLARATQKMPRRDIIKLSRSIKWLPALELKIRSTNETYFNLKLNQTLETTFLWLIKILYTNLLNTSNELYNINILIPL